MWKDVFERLVWTTVAAMSSAFIAAPVFDVAVGVAVGMAGVTAAVSFVMTIARWRLSVLPNPGQAVADLVTLDAAGIKKP